MMRKWISMLMTVALVFTTIMPAASHASMHNDGAKEAVAVADHHDDDHHHDDHHHAVKIASDTQGVKSCCDHAGKKPCCGHGKSCCDKGMCKCPGGNCNGGLAKYFGSGSENLMNFTSSQASFGFAEEHIASALPERLKRPPRA